VTEFYIVNKNLAICTIKQHLFKSTIFQSQFLPSHKF
jgi:hypothetical protein